MSDILTRELGAPAEAPAGRIQVIQGSCGPGLIYRGETVHDPENPSEEAGGWVRGALARYLKGAEPKLALVFGLGLGWHIRRLKELFPGIIVAVYEPDREIIDVFEKYNVLSQGQEPKIYLDFGRFEAFVAQEMVHGAAGFPAVVMVPGCARAFPAEAKKIKDKVDSETARLKVIIKTRQQTSSAFTANLTENAGLAPMLPDLMLLKDRFPPFPAFAVGAGPSLSQNGACLRDVGESGLIIAAGAALKPLLKLGVSPHVIIIIESSDTSRFLTLTEEEKAVLRPDAVLALAMGSHPNHFKVPGYKTAIFHLSGGEAQLLSQGLFLPQGGNAGTAAFALAYVWGLNPVILVGQDQAYQGSMLHAEGTADSVFETDRSGVIAVPGISGAEAETNTSLLASINWFAEAAAIVKRQGKGPRLINATAAGAELKGFEEIPLKALTDAIPQRTPPWKLSDIIGSLPRPTAKELRGDLKQMSRLLTQVRQLVRSKPQRALLEMMNISKASAFMKQILAPALAGGHPADILQNLTWADGVILKMLASLEKHAAEQAAGG